MTLKTSVRCDKVIKKSQSPAFKDLKEGDIIEFSIRIRRVGRSSSGSRAAYIECLNPQTGQVSNLTFNQIPKTLDCFEFTEIEPDYQGILDEIKAKEPEPVAYASSTWSSYQNGYFAAKDDITEIIKKVSRKK